MIMQVFRKKITATLKRRLLVALLAFQCSLLSYAQDGKIAGTITDEKSKETLIGASILVQGTSKGTVTNIDGEYSMNIASGTYTLVVQSMSYEKKVLPNVVVKKGETTALDVAMTEAGIALDNVVIVAKRNLESENILLMEQKESLVAKQSVGAKEMSRKGISDAKGAVAQVAGISKQVGDKNVFVRGLGDRYNTTTLNGFIIPSEDPEYKNISLEFFTNDMIQAVEVSKVFTASMNGDVGGALIDIKSKELIHDKELKIGLSSSLNSQTIGTEMFLPEGMNGFGYTNASYGPLDNLTNYSFNTSLDPVKVSNPSNLSISIAGGKKFLNKHRFYFAGAIGNDYKYDQGVLREITAADAANPFYDMSYKRFTRNSTHLFMGNLQLYFKNLQLSYNSLYIHSASIYHSDSYGKHAETFQVAEDFNSEGLVRRQQVNDNSIFVNQLMLKGKLSDRIAYNFGASVNYILGKEPDRRIFRFPSIGGGMVQLAKAENRNERFNSEITETAFIPKFNIQYKLSSDAKNNSSVGIGYDSRISYKEFSAPIYSHVWNPLIASPTFALNNVFLDTHINQDAYLNKDYKLEYFNDTYDVVRNMHGAFIDVIYQLGNSLTFNGGLRTDYVFAQINYDVNRNADIDTDTLQGFYISPSFNIKYIVNDKNHVRVGSSRTYTLPQDKEISPFVYQGFHGNENGNPNLEISTNYNIDVKWDYYISNSEIFSFTGFYKYILNPIARVDQGNSAGLKTFDNVSDHAIATGVEAEMRKKLLSFANKHTINLGINASYIYSKIELDPKWFVQNTTSELEGSSPYIVNADLTYNLLLGKFSMNAAFVLNYYSDKVHTIGTRGYNNLIEESITTIDYVNSFVINKHFGISFKAMNILNPEYKLTRKGADKSMPGVVIHGYKKGVSFDLSLTYNI